MKIQADKTDL